MFPPWSLSFNVEDLQRTVPIINLITADVALSDSSGVAVDNSK
jgi:hypothetical protein